MTLEHPHRQKRTIDCDGPGKDSSQKKQKLASVSPQLVRPLGNLLLFRGENCRTSGLGILGCLPDEILLSNIFGNDLLTGEDLLAIQGTSKAFFVFCRNEGLWKNLFLQKTRRQLPFWRHSFRISYLLHFASPKLPRHQRHTIDVPTESIKIYDFFSDVLFAQYLSASFDAESLIDFSSLSSSKSSISRVEWNEDFQLPPSCPLIFTNLTDNWTAREWTVEKLARKLETEKFQAEAITATLSEYYRYLKDCPLEECPLYLFDSEFVEKMQNAGLEQGWECPKVFSDDLFQVFTDNRPDYRWLIIGPKNSGSTFHQDPNHTSAWNAVITGRKLWILFPPDVTPPGVRVSDDFAEVSSPFSIAEWMLNYYQPAKAEYGPRAKDLSKRGKMLEGVCLPGEIFYVPSGWWHFVVNLEPSIAITQNFVGANEVGKVMYFLKHRPSQISGFQHQEDLRLIYDEFVTKMSQSRPDMFKKGLEALDILEQSEIKQLTKVVKKHGPTRFDREAVPFTFNFDIDG